MDPQIITAVIAGGLGVFIKASYDGIHEWMKGRKDEAQRISVQLDQARADATRARRFWWAWREHAHLVREMLIRKGTDYSDLPPIPDDTED